MSRSRNIKPGFFQNELLAECQPLARILFAGLWCAADREGRLEDRPRRLRAEYLSYDDCDCDELLQELADRGFIVRYCVDRRPYILVTAFKKHQNPHCKERASVIPEPPGHQSSTVLDSELTVSAQQIPDSVTLIPDSKETATINHRRAPFSQELETENAGPSLSPAAVIESLRRLGITGLVPHYPPLLDLLRRGLGPAELDDAAREAMRVDRGNLPYVLGIIRNRRCHTSTSLKHSLRQKKSGVAMASELLMAEEER